MTEKEIKIKTMELLYRQLESLEENCKEKVCRQQKQIH